MLLLRCAAGSFNSLSGQTGCTSCDSLGDFYQEAPGQEHCDICPRNTRRYLGVLSAANRTSCQCMAGFYHPNGEAGQACDECPKGMICAGKLELPARAESVVIRMAVLIDLSGATRALGGSIIGTVAVALDAINSRLNNMRFEAEIGDSGCTASKGATALSNILERTGASVDAVIGPTCSAGCESTGYITAGLQIPQVSYSCTAASLSEKDKYPMATPLPPSTHPARTRMHARHIHPAALALALALALTSCGQPCPRSVRRAPTALLADLPCPTAVLLAPAAWVQWCNQLRALSAVYADDLELLVLVPCHRRLFELGKLDQRTCAGKR